MKALRWAQAHKWKTLLLAFLAFLLIELATIPWFSIADLKTKNPRETALMRQRREEAEQAGKPYRIRQQWIPLSRIPREVVEAIVVEEDGTFYSHSGFDWYELQESIEKNWEERRAARGASTITQQLAKNLYLSTSKDPIRKLKEALITVLLERELGKRRILELYLNCIEWGRGIFGIGAASETYFGKEASTLTLQEGARLAAVIPSPLRHRPDSDSRYVTRRTRMVLDRLAARNASSPQHQEEVPSSRTDQDEPPDADSTDSQATDGGDGHGL
jgi:monofunctional biosynthetic peptidoglycan transglycosylase